MSRVQLALNVSDLDEAIGFYSSLFGTAPAKVRPGYANFAITDPPLKLVLMEQPEARGSGVAGALNHLGVEVTGPDDVASAGDRLAGEGLAKGNPVLACTPELREALVEVSGIGTAD